ncbi:hypothetical protein I4U23_005945 [Adineta vaga]|nr:hypothetical protein I4U23_005945 [Adineta vaga]
MTGATLGMSETYNKNSIPQKVALQSSFDFIEEGINALDVSNVSIIADYGSSQGANSIQAMRKIIDCLQKQKKSKIDPLVIHNDLPTNDWTSLHRLLNEDKTYHGVASGRSFYEQCLPTNSVAIGFCSTALHWLSKKPCNIPNNYSVDCLRNPKAYKLFQQQANIDYSNFLQHRSSELMSGGILILVMLCCNAEGKLGFQCNFDLLYKCAQLLPMTSNELDDFSIAVFFRSYEDCVDEKFCKQYSFELINSKSVLIPSPIYKQWEEKQITNDEFARLYTEFVRSWNESIVEQTLINNGRQQKEIPELLNRFWNSYEEKLRNEPEKGHSSGNYSYIILKKR